MHKTRSSSHLLTLTLCVAALIMLGSLLAATALAYEGPFCTHWKLASGGSCKSNTVSGIRRAVGRSEGGSTEIAVANQYGELTNRCREISCEVGTGYLQSGTGWGLVANIGSVAHYYYGYLYP